MNWWIDGSSWRMQKHRRCQSQFLHQTSGNQTAQSGSTHHTKRYGLVFDKRMIDPDTFKSYPYYTETRHLGSMMRTWKMLKPCWNCKTCKLVIKNSFFSFSILCDHWLLGVPLLKIIWFVNGGQGLSKASCEYFNSFWLVPDDVIAPWCFGTASL